MRQSSNQLLVRWLVLALGVTLATKLVDGIHCDSTWALVGVVFVLSLLNAVLKPVLLLFTFPFIILSMGLGVMIINAFLFMLAARLVDGFHVAGFWPALWGAVIVSVTNVAMSVFLGKNRRAAQRPTMPQQQPPQPPRPKDPDVIDI